MKRRTFIKISAAAFGATALPFNVMSAAGASGIISQEFVLHPSAVPIRFF